MTPKEKAEELIKKFGGHHVIMRKNTKGRPVQPYISCEMQNAVIEIQSKEFALICVDEILEAISNCDDDYNIGFDRMEYNYYTLVKQEILNL